jgi:hypothetical protein
MAIGKVIYQFGWGWNCHKRLLTIFNSDHSIA